METLHEYEQILKEQLEANVIEIVPADRTDASGHTSV